MLLNKNNILDNIETAAREGGRFSFIDLYPQGRESRVSFHGGAYPRLGEAY